MLEVRVPIDIKHYKEKLFFGFSLRQSICVFVMLAINVPLYLIGSEYIPSDIMNWLIVLIAVPIIGIGFVNINEMPFEQFLVIVVKFNLNKQKRKKERKVDFTV